MTESDGKTIDVGYVHVKEDTGGCVEKCPHPDHRMCPPLTTRDVIAELSRMVEKYPEYADRSVYILDMEDDNAPETEFTGLVTHIEFDCMYAAQGPVIVLHAWRDRDVN